MEPAFCVLIGHLEVGLGRFGTRPHARVNIADLEPGADIVRVLLEQFSVFGNGLFKLLFGGELLRLGEYFVFVDGQFWVRFGRCDKRGSALPQDPSIGATISTFYYEQIAYEIVKDKVKLPKIFTNNQQGMKINSRQRANTRFAPTTN